MAVLRLSGLAVCLLEAAGTLLQASGRGVAVVDEPLLACLSRLLGQQGVGTPGYAVLHLLLLALFAACYWSLTQRPARRRAGQGMGPLLALNGLALLAAPGLPFVMTAVAAWQLSSTAALRFALAQVAVAWGLASLMPGALQQADAAATRLPALVYALGQGLGLLALHGLAYGFGRMAADEADKRQRLQAALAELASQEKLQAEQLRFAERLQMTRDLHDVMGHHLSALTLQLELARELVGRHEAARAAAPLEQAHHAAQRLLADVRDTVSLIREHRRIDLSDALHELASRIEHPRITMEIDPAARDLPPRLAHAALRCVQEAVTNAVRHAGAGQVRVSVRCRGDELSVVTRDDGRGAAEFRPGNGLAGMQERIAELGGRLQVVRTRGGFEIAWACPLETR